MQKTDRRVLEIGSKAFITSKIPFVTTSTLGSHYAHVPILRKVTRRSHSGPLDRGLL